MTSLHHAARAARTLAAGAAVAGALAGCAGPAIDANIAAAHADVQGRAHIDFQWLTSDAARAQARDDVAAALRQPLGEDDAVRIALSYSPALQAVLFDRAAASADATQSARLPNPVFTLERLASGGVPDHIEVTRSLTLPLVDLLQLHSRMQGADATQQRLRLQLAVDVLRSADAARVAWVDAVAAGQSARYARQVLDAAEAGTTLARRMEAAGNFSALQRAREEAFEADALTELARARRAQRTTRETLVRALGLDAGQAAALQLPEHLPDLPPAPPDGASTSPAGTDAETVDAASADASRAALQSALDTRLDLQLAKARLAEVARVKGLTRAFKLVNGLALGPERHDETGQANERGILLSVPLPVFDTGDAVAASGEAAYQAALQRTAALAADAASQLRVAQGDLGDTYALARTLRDRVVPLRATIAGDDLLRYNGMLASVFELLADAREQARGVQQAIAAQRDFWLADAAWDTARAGIPTPADDVARSDDDGTTPSAKDAR